MSDKAQRTIRIKWVRSGIGFTYHQKRIVRSLGLKKLNQEVERPDTPQIRGLVAKVPHLVKIVEAASKAAWTLVPEYTIYAPEAVASKLAETAPETPAEEIEKTEAAATGEVTGAPAAAADEPQPVEAPTAVEVATETPGGLAATEIRMSADASAEESAKAGEEAGSEEGQPKA
ncbi:MAG: 50S ribosomal protein L30 [Terriglobia bacterium]